MGFSKELNVAFHFNSKKMDFFSYKSLEWLLATRNKLSCIQYHSFYQNTFRGVKVKDMKINLMRNRNIKSTFIHFLEWEMTVFMRYAFQKL